RQGGAVVSDIKRHKAVGSGVVRTDPKGDLVLYVDYARLKDEVERLTKAGDAMAMAYAQECLDERGGVGSTIENFYNNIEPIKAWEAAKGDQP
ncbi:hypothetical protein EBT31_04690, partial [bacterium]|nr:hypothetical protein [bacterium]